MRFILDTNILIPLNDSQRVLEPSLATFIRLANTHGHTLLFHELSEEDIKKDNDQRRKQQTLQRIEQYTRIPTSPGCPWNDDSTSRNDRVDNEILYSLQQSAAHGLITEDRGIHSKAKKHGLQDSVYTIQTASDFLQRLHRQHEIDLPNIANVELHTLTNRLHTEFFDSLRAGYGTEDFNKWFRAKAKDGRKAWVNWSPTGELGGICIYARQNNEQITDTVTLEGTSLKLCTFKVSDESRGRKIGELFLKAAFRYATENQLQHIFIHGDEEEHRFLFLMLEDFGFKKIGSHPGCNSRDAVYLKQHPIHPPDDEKISTFEYSKIYFPHYRNNASVSIFIVPIEPKYHETLFPDYESAQMRLCHLPTLSNSTGNAIKQAYLSHAQTKSMTPGDIVLFYRSGDERAVTSIGIVESYKSMSDADMIAAHVKRRTVYSMKEIKEMARKPTKVMLFRLVGHLRSTRSLDWLIKKKILKGPPQSIGKLNIDQLTYNEIISDES